MRNIRIISRRLACALLLVSLFSGYDFGAFRPIPTAEALDNSLLAHWTFDVAGGGVAEDESGNGHDATLTGGVAGFVGTAPFVESNSGSYTFDGISGTYVGVPHDADFNVGTITISAWVRLADYSQANGAGIICKGTGGGGEVWCIDVYEGAYRFFSSSGLAGSVTATSGLSTEWTHIVATYDGLARKIYINGRLENSYSELGALDANSHEISIGCRQESSADYDLCFNGQIDDVRIYDDALSAEEVANLTFRGISSFWNFEEGSGADTQDASENTYDAVLLPFGIEPDWIMDTPPTIYGVNQFALEFDGGNYVSTETGSVIDGQDNLSVSAWVRVDEYQTQRAVFSNYTPAGNGILIETGTVGNDVLIAINDGSNPFAMTSIDAYQTGDWHLWTVVYDGDGGTNEDRLKFYIDGIEQALTFHNNIPATVGTSAKDLTFGASLDDEERYFIGAIDEIQLFERSLSDDELSWLALYAENGGGSYEVEDCDDLQDVSLDLEGNYLQTANIDCDGFDFEPIGNGDAFEGHYDGNGFTIGNLEISGSGFGGSGLFSEIGSDGQIERVGIVSGSIDVSDIVAGAIAGSNDGEISESFARIDVSGAQLIGGLVGANEGTILNSYATGNVRAQFVEEDISGAGGLVGINLGLIANAYALGSVEGGAVNGGLIGFTPTGEVYNVFAAGEVQDGVFDAFGIGGFQEGAILENSIWNSELTGQMDCGAEEGCSDETDIFRYAHNGIEPFLTWNATEKWYIQENDYPILLWEAPVAYYRFDGANGDESLTPDASYSNNNLSLYPGDNLPVYDEEDLAPTPDNLFFNDGSIVFDGVGQYAHREEFNNLPSSNLTICTWLKTTDAEAYIAQQGRGVFDFDTEYVFNVNAGGKLNFWDYQNDYGFADDESSNSVVNDGEWHHACFVKEGLDGVYYVDGVEDGTVTATLDAEYSSNDFAIGRDVGDDISALSGKLDDFRVYNRPLAAAEIAALAGVEQDGGGEVGMCSITLHWDMNEGSGAVLESTSGTSEDGIIDGPNPVTWSADTPDLDADNPYSIEFTEDGQGIDLSMNIDDAFTVSMWIKPEALGFDDSDGTLIGQYPITALFYDFGEGSGGYMMYPGEGSNISNDTLITPDQWHHIALVNDGGDATFYLDGVEDGTFIDAPFLNFNVAGGVAGYGTTFNGKMDDIRVYVAALSAEQIAEIAGGGEIMCAETNLCAPDAHWSYDAVDTENNVVPDDSDNGYNGVFNATLSEDVPTIGISNEFSMEDGTTSFPESPKSVGSDFSISLWMKIGTFMDSWANIASEIDDDEIGLWLSGEGNGPDAYKLSFYNGDDNQLTDSALSTGEWHHIVLVNDGSQADFYIDGVHDAAVPGFGGGFDIQAIGDSTFPGLIDDVRVYDALLTEEQIATLAGGELSCEEEESEPVCPPLADAADDSVISDGICYMYFSNPVTWATAEAQCNTAEGGHLVSIETNPENNTVATLSPAGGAWIGANDIESENAFAWSSGDAFVYTNWNSGEPNNSMDSQHCVQIYDDGTWDDTDCENGQPYVCEAPTVLLDPVITWEGDVSNDWYDEENWNPEALPNDSSSVVIPDTEHDPILTSSASIDSLIIGTGAFLTLDGYVLNIDEGTFINHGTLAIHGDEELDLENDLNHGGMVMYTGTGTYDTLVLGNEFANLTIMQGQLDLGEHDLNVYGELNIDGSGSMLNGSGVYVRHMNIGGMLYAPLRLEIGASWNNHGTFESNDGEVKFTGGEVDIEGDTTFHDFTINTLGTMTFHAGDTFTIEGDLYVHGYAGQYQFRSDDEGERWYIDPQGERDIEHLDVQDSENINEEDIDCSGVADCIDSGNNVGWAFEPLEEICGDGGVVGEEACDDGNTDNGDGCNDQCGVEEGWYCGEVGDNGVSFCLETCLPEAPSFQDGNRCYYYVHPELDDREWSDAPDACLFGAGGNLASVTGALLQFNMSVLADGNSGWIGLNDLDNPGTFVWILGDTYAYSSWDDSQPNPANHCTVMQEDGSWATEDCEDEYGYFCSFSTVCGDGAYTFFEDCDDGNTANGDGCSASCEDEEGWECISEPGAMSECHVTACGDLFWDDEEDCEDGNLINGDGCSSLCEEEDGFACDYDEDTELSSCYEIFCGDENIEGSEDCDDGNTANGDGCSATCHVESGFICSGEPSECTALCNAHASDASMVATADGKCFGYYNASIQWADAKSACESRSGTLAIIENEAQNEAVSSLYDYTDMWIGATDAAVEGTFIWVDNTTFWAATPRDDEPEDDGEILGVYHSWTEGEPNNFTGYGADGEDCVEIYAEGVWNDNSCTTYRPYVCEWPIESLSSASSESLSSRPSGGGGGGGGGGWRNIQTNTSQHSASAASGSARSSKSGRSSAASKTSIASIKDPLKVRVGDAQLTFDDVSLSAWYAPYIKKLVELGGINGYQDAQGKSLGIFKPGNNISYAEMIKILMKISGKNSGDLPSNPSARDTWAAPFIAGAELAGLDILNTQIDVHAQAKRWEVIGMILEMLDIPLQDSVDLSYGDVRYLHPGYRAIETATKLGIITGDTDAAGNPIGTFRPDDLINRAEAAKMIVTALRAAGK